MTIFFKAKFIDSSSITEKTTLNYRTGEEVTRSSSPVSFSKSRKGTEKPGHKYKSRKRVGDRYVYDYGEEHEGRHAHGSEKGSGKKEGLIVWEEPISVAGHAVIKGKAPTAKYPNARIEIVQREKNNILVYSRRDGQTSKNEKFVGRYNTISEAKKAVEAMYEKLDRPTKKEGQFMVAAPPHHFENREKAEQWMKEHLDDVIMADIIDGSSGEVLLETNPKGAKGKHYFEAQERREKKWQIQHARDEKGWARYKAKMAKDDEREKAREGKAASKYSREDVAKQMEKEFGDIGIDLVNDYLSDNPSAGVTDVNTFISQAVNDFSFDPAQEGSKKLSAMIEHIKQYDPEFDYKGRIIDDIADRAVKHAESKLNKKGLAKSIFLSARDLLSLIKAKKMAIGTTAEWGGKQYKKEAEGVWKPVGGERPGGRGEGVANDAGGGKEPKTTKELHDKFMDVLARMTDTGRAAFRGGKFDAANKQFVSANGKHALQYRDGEIGIVSLKKSRFAIFRSFFKNDAAIEEEMIKGIKGSEKPGHKWRERKKTATGYQYKYGDEKKKIKHTEETKRVVLNAYHEIRKMIERGEVDQLTTKKGIRQIIDRNINYFLPQPSKITTEEKETMFRLVVKDIRSLVNKSKTVISRYGDDPKKILIKIDSSLSKAADITEGVYSPGSGNDNLLGKTKRTPHDEHYEHPDAPIGKKMGQRKAHDVIKLSDKPLHSCSSSEKEETYKSLHLVPDAIMPRLFIKSVPKSTYDHPDKLGAGAKKRKHLHGKDKVEAVMHEYKHGTLRSGSGKHVTNKKQAVAIAMSEAGLSNEK